MALFGTLVQPVIVPKVHCHERAFVFFKSTLFKVTKHREA